MRQEEKNRKWEGERKTQNTACTSPSIYSEDKMVERRLMETAGGEMKLTGNWNIFRLKEETSENRCQQVSS